MKKLLSFVLVGLFMVLGPTIAFGFSYVVNDFTFYPVPDVERPAKGESYVDSTFHTNITRITDCRMDCDGGYCSVGYPKHNIENADGTLILVQGSCGNGWNFFNANPPYEYVTTLPSNTFGWSRPIDPRWSNTDPDIIYCTMSYAGHKLYKYNVRTGEITIIFDFQEILDANWPGMDIRHVSMYEEGDASDDRRYWAYMVVAFNAEHSPQWWKVGMLVLDKDFYGEDNGKVIALLKEGDPGFYPNGFSSMSPSGKYVWTGDSHRIYPRDLSSVRKVDITTGHADMAYSMEGREVIAGFYSGYAAMGDIETGEITKLAKMLGGGHHVSANCHIKPGWAVYSRYYPEYPNPETVWGDHEVFMVELTTRTDPPPKVWRLAHTHGILVSYNDAPFAKINMKGTKVFFGSAWGQHYKDEGASYDLYQIDLPENWYEDLGGEIPPPPPPPPPATRLEARWTQVLLAGPDQEDLTGFEIWFSADQTYWDLAIDIPYTGPQTGDPIECSYQFDFPQTEGIWYFRAMAYDDEIPANCSNWSEVASIDLTPVEPPPEPDKTPPINPGGFVIEKVQE